MKKDFGGNKPLVWVLAEKNVLFFETCIQANKWMMGFFIKQTSIIQYYHAKICS